MEKLLALALAGACSAASAQTPANNPMPDGSRDTYVGLGIVSAPEFEGARKRELSALPVLQAAWSNGVFISGLTAGMHLSDRPALEFGPLVALQPRRDESGVSGEVGAIEDISSIGLPEDPTFRLKDVGELEGMDVQHSRILAGVFLNYYLMPQLRLTNTLLYGSGNECKGAVWRGGIQYIPAGLPAHHFLSLGAGISVANRRHNDAFFGVTEDESMRTGIEPYGAAGGLRDLHVNARWNWSFTPSWLLTTGLQASRLQRSAADSPLTARPTNLTVSTALAYRF